MGSQCPTSLMLLPLNRTLEPVKSVDWTQVPVTRIQRGGGGISIVSATYACQIFSVQNSDFGICRVFWNISCRNKILVFFRVCSFSISSINEKFLKSFQ